MKHIFLIFAFISVVLSVEAQVIYKTMAGHAVVIRKNDSTKIIAESHKSIIVYNYRTAEMEARINLKTFETGVRPLDSLLKAGNEKWVTFKGKMGIDYINTQKHPEQSFDIVGNLTLNSITKPVTFKAILTHFSGSGDIACILSANTTLKLKEFNLQQLLSEFNDTFKIEFIQAVLRREANY